MGIYGGVMNTSKTIKKICAISLILSILLSMCGCSAALFGGDDRTLEEYAQEAKDVSTSIMQNIIRGNFANIKRYIRSSEEDEVEQMLVNMEDDLRKYAKFTLLSSYTDPKSYATDVEFNVTLVYGEAHASVLCCMRLKRSGGKWIVENGIPITTDLQTVNANFQEELKKENEKKN